MWGHGQAAGFWPVLVRPQHLCTKRRTVHGSERVLMYTENRKYMPTTVTVKESAAD